MKSAAVKELTALPLEDASPYILNFDEYESMYDTVAAFLVDVDLSGVSGGSVSDQRCEPPPGLAGHGGRGVAHSGMVCRSAGFDSIIKALQSKYSTVQFLTRFL